MAQLRCSPALIRNSPRWGRPLLSYGLRDLVLGVARAGIAVPDQLAVVGVGKSGIAALLSPALITIGIPHYCIGLAAERRLLRRLSGGAVDPRCLDMGFEPVIREAGRARLAC